MDPRAGRVGHNGRPHRAATWLRPGIQTPAMTEPVRTDTVPTPTVAAPAPGEGDRWDRSGRVALAVVGVAWVVIGIMILARPVFITHDSLSNNVHVWWIAERIWGAGPPHPGNAANLVLKYRFDFDYDQVPENRSVV